MLSEQAQNILDYLVAKIDSGKIRAGKPETYLAYSQVHKDLQFPYIANTYGKSLDKNGMGELAEWTKVNGIPAVTGLIISKSDNDGKYSQRLSYMVPGPGYFEMFEKRDLDFLWWEEEVKKSLNFDWSQFSTPTLTGQIFPEEIGNTYTEGSSVKVTVNRYERSAKARKECIEHWGAQCQVCLISFSDAYGSDIGDDFIHVHHLTPLKEVSEHHEVNPKLDLIPLCPNCHAMVHRTEPPMEPEVLKERYMRLTSKSR
ncbi:HNH endonuclease [Photobacterium leiognathi]|uniref:HNH endonuclease n=1 Tax=Photobacterium leiognathi TaxID=553611 RepID=UPI0029827FEB|nr:HNH endonuclease [Photobacterium leiognathi]